MANIIRYTGNKTFTATTTNVFCQNAATYWYTGSLSPAGASYVINGIYDDGNNSTSTDFTYNTALTNNYSATFKTASNIYDTTNGRFPSYVMSYIKILPKYDGQYYGPETFSENYVEVRQAVNSLIVTNQETNILWTNKSPNQTQITIKGTPANAFDKTLHWTSIGYVGSRMLTISTDTSTNSFTVPIEVTANEKGKGTQMYLSNLITPNVGCYFDVRTGAESISVVTPTPITSNTYYAEAYTLYDISASILPTDVSDSSYTVSFTSSRSDDPYAFIKGNIIKVSSVSAQVTATSADEFATTSFSVEINKHSVNFYNGTSLLATFYDVKGTNVTPPTVSSSSDTTIFVGWSLANGDESQVVQPIDKIGTTDVNYYAIFSTKTYTITWDYNDADGGYAYGGTTAANLGDTIVFPTTNTLYKYGKRHTGSLWSDGPDYAAGPTTKTTVTGNMTFYSWWGPLLYNFKLNANDSDISDTPATISGYSGSSMAVGYSTDDWNILTGVTISSHDGYDFLGWSTDPDAVTPNINKYTSVESLCENGELPMDYATESLTINLYAVWHAQISGYHVVTLSGTQQSLNYLSNLRITAFDDDDEPATCITYNTTEPFDSSNAPFAYVPDSDYVSIVMNIKSPTKVYSITYSPTSSVTNFSYSQTSQAVQIRAKILDSVQIIPDIQNAMVVTMDPNGGRIMLSNATTAITSKSSMLIDYGGTAPSVTDATKTQTNYHTYTFSGMSYTGGGTNLIPLNTTYSPVLKDMNFYARWTSLRRVFTITFNANATGAVLSKTSATALYNGSVTTPTATTVKPQTVFHTYTLSGFNTSNTATSATVGVGASYRVTASRTLYAVWKGTLRNYTYTFDQGGGTTYTLTGEVVTSATTTAGSQVTLPATGTYVYGTVSQEMINNSNYIYKYSYALKGWNDYSTSFGASTWSYGVNTAKNVYKNATLYPVWGKTSYVTYFYANRGGDASLCTFKYLCAYAFAGKPVITPSYTYSGWSLTGWATSASGSVVTTATSTPGVFVTPNITIASVNKFYAIWTKL